MQKASLLLLLVLVLPITTATSVTRDVVTEEIRTKGSAWHLPEYFETDILLTVNIDTEEPFYFIRENLPTGIEVIETDLDVISPTMLGKLVVGDMQNITYRYRVKDRSSVQRGVRFYGDYFLGSTYWNGYYSIDGEQLLDIQTVRCNTEFDANNNRKIDYKEYLKAKSMYRSGKITIGEYGEMYYYYMKGEGC